MLVGYSVETSLRHPCTISKSFMLYNIYVDYVMVFGLEQEDGNVIPPMALAHPLHPIRSKSRNKRRNLWDGLCVSSSRPSFWSVYSLYHYIHTMYYSCILSNWNKLFLRDIYIPKVGVGVTVCRMIWYRYSFLSGVKCIFQLHTITVYRTGFWVCVILVLSGIMCSF